MDEELTPFQQKGWTKGMLFEVGEGDADFTERSILQLYDDDGTVSPLFKLLAGECKFDLAGGQPGAHIDLDNLRPIGHLPEASSDESFVSIGGVALPKKENVSGDHTDSEKGTVTGGSSPKYYRKSVPLPLTEDRKKFVTVDIEAGDVCELFDLGWNGGNVFKSMARGDNKDGVDLKYALDKELWFVLRRRMEYGLITHSEFWEAAEYLGLTED